MLKLLLPNNGRPLAILCLGAHSDDLEIGCGGSILRLLAETANVQVHWVVFSAREARGAEAKESAELFLAQAGQKKIVPTTFTDGFFPYHGDQVKEFFEALKQEISPDLIFTHYRHDLHQDHRLICELTWNTFRNHLILEYEIPKYDGDLGAPNFFIHLDESICRKKIEHLMTAFKSQTTKQWFTEDLFWSLLRLRGMEANATERFAEAFYCRKIAF